MRDKPIKGSREVNRQKSKSAKKENDPLQDKLIANQTSNHEI